jgi:hypothetical protein
MLYPRISERRRIARQLTEFRRRQGGAQESAKRLTASAGFANSPFTEAA